MPEDTNIKPNDTSQHTNIEMNHKQTTTEDETPKQSFWEAINKTELDEGLCYNLTYWPKMCIILA